jgi:hypothetical protein
VTKTFTMEGQDDRAPPQWLVSAFLVLLSVAILAAVPANSAANRGTAQAAGAFEGPTERIVVRAKIQIRVLQSQPADSPDFALVTDEFPPISLESDRILPRIDDAGERIASRGIKIRAPPANVA